MKSKIHGALPRLKPAEAWHAANLYVAEIDQGVVKTYDDYLELAGDNGVHLPQALGSLVLHYGQGGTRAAATLRQRQPGWNFEASALRTYRSTHIILCRQHRSWWPGSYERDDLSFIGDDAASGSASSGGTTYDINLHWRRGQHHPHVGHGAELAGFLTTSQSLVQDFLSITAAMES